MHSPTLLRPDRYLLQAVNFIQEWMRLNNWGVERYLETDMVLFVRAILIRERTGDIDVSSTHQPAKQLPSHSWQKFEKAIRIMYGADR
jgi:hypothetical protein